MKLKDALKIKPGEIISLVGGGGKTTLMYALAKELSQSGAVVTTTTTKIFPPAAGESPLLILDDDELRLMERVMAALRQYRSVTAARRKLPSGKLVGVTPDFIASLGMCRGISYIINEADGAAGRPLKAPNYTEPVIPDNTSLLITVVGIEAVGCRLAGDCVFRPEIASRLLGLPIGSVLSAKDVATLLAHPEGVVGKAPEKSRTAYFINKVDMDPSLEKPRELATEILKRAGHYAVVILGQANRNNPVVEVIKK